MRYDQRSCFTVFQSSDGGETHHSQGLQFNVTKENYVFINITDSVVMYLAFFLAL